MEIKSGISESNWKDIVAVLNKKLMQYEFIRKQLIYSFQFLSLKFLWHELTFNILKLLFAAFIETYLLFLTWPDDLCWPVLLRRDEGSAYDFQHKTDAENNQYIIPHLYCIVGFILQSTFDIIMMFPNSTIEPEFFFFLVQQDIFSAFTL